MGLNLGRGTIVSVILVLFVLPQLLLVGDKIVEKTKLSFIKKKNATEIKNSKVKVSGRVTGDFNGTIDGVIDAVLDGDVNLTLLSGEVNEKKEDD